MSVIGPRPGLWNQDVLTAERDKYNANDVKPGLTGWAQINGRDVFGVYLLNDHPYAREFLWQKIFHCKKFYNSVYANSWHCCTNYVY